MPDPDTIHIDQLRAAYDALGLDAHEWRGTARIDAAPHEVTVTRYLRDPLIGAHYFDDLGEIASETTRIPVRHTAPDAPREMTTEEERDLLARQRDWLLAKVGERSRGEWSWSGSALLDLVHDAFITDPADVAPAGTMQDCPHLALDAGGYPICARSPERRDMPCCNRELSSRVCYPGDTLTLVTTQAAADSVGRMAERLRTVLPGVTVEVAPWQRAGEGA